MPCDQNLPNDPAYDCATELRALFYAYRKLIRGAKTVEIEQDGGRVKYELADVSRIAILYNDLYKTCGNGTGLPASISISSKIGDPGTVNRGPLIRGRFV